MKRKPVDEQPIPTMPFDEALKRMLATPPDHKTTKKQADKPAKK